MREPILAMYLRSSVEQNAESRNTNNPDESDTISNQRKLLYGEIKSRALTEYRVIEYVDDGHTGINFERPAFQRMIQDAKHGMVQALIVKDFSRMGRDYIGTGDYLEQFFPAMGIRVISVNDNWDSEEHLGETLELDASFRTLLYDMYSRDLSKKRRTANQIRREKGIYCTCLTPYGYQKSDTDNHQLVIDPEEAPVVKRIFDMVLSGMKMPDIAKTLTAEGIPTPSARNKELGLYSREGLDAWRKNSVYTILRNEMYTGTLILNRYEFEYGVESMHLKDRSEWMYFPDRHEAIVSKTDYDEVQRILQYIPRGKAQQKREYYPLYCGHCGLKLSRTTKMEDLLCCRKSLGTPNAPCSDIYIRRSVFEKTMVDLINLQVRLFGDWAKIRLHQMDGQLELERQIKELHAESDCYRQKRKELYAQFREGSIDKDAFLEKKLECIHLEEEVMAEIEQAEFELRQIEEERKRIQDKADELSGCFLTEYDENVVKSLVSKVEAFNDGHIKVHWRFSEELSDFRSSNEKAAVSYSRNDYCKCAVYSSDMFFRTDENDGEAGKRVADIYCRHQLSVKRKDIVWFHDSRDDGQLFYRCEYMKMMALAKEGKCEMIVVRNIGDLHLSRAELYDLMLWTLPQLSVRFISVEDQFDSQKIAEDDWDAAAKKLYEKYAGIMRSDQLLFRKDERISGKRTVPEPTKPKCTALYGYYYDENGCYADPEAIEWVKRIYQLFLDGKSHLEIVPILNEAKVPTLMEFYIKYGMTKRTEKDHTWNSEKLAVFKHNRKFATDCRHKKLCESLGRHCERKPIISQEIFDAVDAMFKYKMY